MPAAQAGLSPHKSTLGNGVVVLAKETRKTPIVAINLAVAAGSVCDPPDGAGAINLLARTIDRGTTTRSAADVAEALDSRGIGLNILVSRHQLSLVCTCLVEDFEPIVALLGDIIMNPSLPEQELTTRKGEVVTAIRQDEDNPYVRAFEGLMATLYGEVHPYGRRVKGTIESVEALSREALAALHRARFAPGQLTAVFVGDVATPRVMEVAERVFGVWRAADPPPVTVPEPPPPSGRTRVVIPMMNKAQADIAYGFTAISRRDPRYHAYWLMNNVLGQYAIGGRLGDSIRERQGMAYYVGSALDANVGRGPLAIRAGVNPANVDRAVASIDEELARLCADGLTEQELNDSRRYIIGSMPRALETNAGIANFLQMSALFELGLDYDVRVPALLHAVTLEEANAAARSTVEPSRATVVIAGPYEDR
jgi:zinc protease